MSQYKAYPSYKDSGVEWIGRVPEHWDVKRLRHVAVFNNSNVDKKGYEDQRDVKLCNYTDVYYNEFITPDLAFMDATASDAEFEKFRLKKGDVIITKDSEDPRDIGIPALVMHDMDDVVCGYHLTVIKASENDFSGFIHRSIQAHPTKAHFFVESPGITRFGLDQDAIGDIPICVPPNKESLFLTKALDRETARIDTLIQKKTRFIELLKERRQALPSYAVIQGLDSNVDMKYSGVEWIGDVPENWEIYRVATLFKEVNRPGISNLPILSISIHDGITDKELSPEDRDRQMYQIEDRTKYKRVLPGDIAYNMMRAWQGAFGAVRVEGLVSPAYVVARPKRDFRTRYIELLLRTPMAIEEMRRFSRGIADFRMRLYWEHFREVRVCLPPLEEQDAILAYIELETLRIEQLIGRTQRSITLLKERRSAFITAAVTGQIDLRGEQ